MNVEPKFRNIEDQYINGLGVQYLLASKNRLILKELKNIHPYFKDETPQYLKDLLLYLAGTAKRDTIMSLSKIFDRPSKRNNKLRNISKFLNQLKLHSKELFNTIDLIENSWANFIQKHSKLISKYPELNTNKESFIDVIQEVLIKLQVKDQLIDRLRIWRDKFLAHNERFPNEISFSDEEIDTLFEIAYIIFDLSNSFFNIGIVIIETPKISFIKEVFKEHIY